MQDINLALRDTLKNFMNDVEYTTELKYRWISYRRASDVANAIQVDDKMLDIEWSEIINMKSAQQTTDHTESKNLSSSTLNSDLNSKTISPSQALIYLEDIHIFALANLLYRTIIVISLDTLRNIQPIHLRGIYLPLLRRPDECCKDPIVIAFHNFHFVPLLFPLDEENLDNSSEILSTEKYFHFDNIDESDARDYDTIDDFKYSTTLLSKNSSTSTMMSTSSGLLTNNNSTVSVKRKTTRFYNSLPLFYYNLEQMKIHFLKESEEKNSQSYLNKYLNLVEARITIDDPQQYHRGFLNENQTLTVLCCYLHKDSRNKRVKHDGITTYLNFLNDSIKKNGNKVAGSNYKNNVSNISDDSLVMPPSSPSRMTPAHTPSITPIPVQIVSTEDPQRTITRCKSDYCSERVSDSSNFGYCSKCFKKNVQTTPAATTTPSPITKKEIEAEKDAQQYQFVSSKATALPSYSSPVPHSPLTTSTEIATPMPSDKETQQKTSAKLAEINRKIQITSVTRKPNSCSSPQCNSLVQSYNDEYCASCKESLIADATRSTPATSNLRHNSVAVNKQLERVTSSRVSSSKSPVQIPVKHDTNITSSSSTNKISAYNLTPESKLYKPNSMLRPGIYEDTSHSSSNRISSMPRVTSNAVLEDYDTSAYGIIHDLRRPTRDVYGNYQSRNTSFPFCSNCKYRQVEPTGASSFCNSCRMNPYSKLYY